MSCDCLRRRVSTGSCPDLVLGAGELAGAFLDRTRYMHAPSGVAEVTLDLAEDRRSGEGDERLASLRLVSVDCVDEPDAGCLVDILDRLASSLVAACEPARVREELEDDRLPRASVTRRAAA